MAKSNRARVEAIMDMLRNALGPYVLAQFKARYRGKHLSEMEYALYESNRPQHLPDAATALEKLDIQSWLNLINRRWHEAFRSQLSQTERNYVSELRGAGSKWAHQRAFSNDDAHRIADTAARLLEAIGADKAAAAARKHAHELLRLRYDRDAEKSRRQPMAIDDAPLTTAAGIKPWRLVIQPHSDVLSGHYTQAEFAADLAQVVQGKAAMEYGDAKAFFRRTYLTQGLQDLLVTGWRRLTGEGGDPVAQLQTSFGGGKTHSMLALYHLFGGEIQLNDLPGAEDIIERIGAAGDPVTAQRAVIVGTAFDANEPRRHPNCSTYTLWGEIAWQLGGIEAYNLVANADMERISPGSDTLLELLENYGPALIVMDELIAFVRNLYQAPRRPSAGSFDSVMTFMQALTEAVRRSSDSMLLVSIPDSETEIGGEGGAAALESLTKTIGRIEAVWKPVSATEGFRIVRQRLFAEVTDAPARDAALMAFRDMYQRNSADFPPGVADSDYQRLMAQAYPIHPELFARLYEDWSSLERFQRTRGVLRLMAAVIHQLWNDNDQSLMIMPASVPLWQAAVRDEMLRYLPDGWPPVLDADIDGDESKPAQLDRQAPALGQLHASRRVARAIFIGSAPSVAAQRVRGIEEVRIRLATIQPGERTAPFTDALHRMGKLLTYLYSDGSRYWYDTRPTVNRMAQDRAQIIPKDDAHQEAVRRLRDERKPSGVFAAVHVAPETSADVVDEARARLVVIDPSHGHHRLGDSDAQQFARDILENRGASPRHHRNMLVFIAADKARAAEWDKAIRSWLAWKSISDEREKLNLDMQQLRQVTIEVERAEETLNSRLQETYCWLIAPTQQEPLGPTDLPAQRIPGRESFYKRAEQRLARNELITHWSPDALRLSLEEALWRGEPHLNIKQLWGYLTRYCWLPRLYDENVLLNAIRDGVQRLDMPFAYATGLNEDGSYRGLVMGARSPLYFDGNDLIVKPDIAAEQLAQQPTQPPFASEPSPRAGTASPPSETDAPPTPPAKKKTRYYGRAALNPQRVNRDVPEIVEEVIQHLTSLMDADVEIRLEISARRPDGFDEKTIRTVSENSRTLKFDEHGFEE